MSTTVDLPRLDGVSSDSRMESPESTLVPGYRLDRYELLCPIASGGMASVWLARLQGKRGFEKLFAIKTIKTELISDAHFQEMFLDEARIASRIIHPNVAQILELGEENDVLYIVMEYVDGDSVAKVNRLSNKRGSPLPPGVAMRIIADMCAGLHAAHQLKDQSGESLGVIHRDVSPQNVLVAASGEAKVIDFGLVKAKGRGAAETQSGVVKGKIRYMAPEQVGGKSIDHRADIWAAGMCLYELITGHVPYHKEDDLDIVKRLMSSQPLPNVDLALPPQIEKILSRAIVPDPNGRFDTCSAMRRAIEAAIHELGVPGEHEDVADFLKTTLPELGSKREKTIEAAMSAANARREGSASRAPPPGSLAGQEPGELAFANTEVSARDQVRSEVTAHVERRRSSAPPPTVRERGRAPAADDDDSDSGGGSNNGTPAGTTLREQLGEQNRRSSVGFWFAAIAVVGAGAAIVYSLKKPPSDPPPTAATATAAPSVSASASAPPPVTSEEPPPITSASSPVTELDPVAQPDAGAAPITSASAGLKSPGPPGHRPHGHPEPGSPPQAAATWDGGLSPGARAAAAIMLTPKAPDPPPTSTATWPNTPDDPKPAQ
jgi:serine/threonine protein kinase